MPRETKPEKRATLHDAAWLLAPRAMRRAALSERSQPPEPISFSKFESERANEITAKIAKLWNAGQNFLHGHINHYEPTPEMKKLLLRRLSEGNPVAVGIRMKPRSETKPSIIPTFIFKNAPEIDWKKNSIDNFGQRFEGVEVELAIRRGKTTSADQDKLKKSVGRPSVNETIIAVVRELRDKNAFAGKIEKERVTIVQDHCRERDSKRFPKPSLPSKTKVREILKREKI